MTEPVKPCGKCGEYPNLSRDRFAGTFWYRCYCANGEYVTEVAAREAWNRRATGQTEREATEPDTTLFGLELRYSSYLPADGLYVNPEYLKVPDRSLASAPPEKKP